MYLDQFQSKHTQKYSHHILFWSLVQTVTHPFNYEGDRTEQHSENKICKSIRINSKILFVPYLNPKISQLGQKSLYTVDWSWPSSTLLFIFCISYKFPTSTSSPSCWIIWAVHTFLFDHQPSNLTNLFLDCRPYLSDPSHTDHCDALQKEASEKSMKFDFIQPFTL